MDDIPEDCEYVPPGSLTFEQCKEYLPEVTENFCYLDDLSDDEKCEIKAVFNEIFDFFAITGEIPRRFDFHRGRIDKKYI